MFSLTGRNESTQLERFTRKFQEQYLAVQIEKKYDKNVILENYLNTIDLECRHPTVYRPLPKNTLTKTYGI